MGKASRKKQQKREGRTSAAASLGVAADDDPRALGEQALERLMRSSTPGKLSLAGAYAWGYVALGSAQQEGADPEWHQEIDPLDALFLGAAWPQEFQNEFQFANLRDAWLRLLRGTVHGKGIERFVHETVSASQDLGMSVDDGELMLALAGRLEAAGLDQRRLPRRLLPSEALREHRAAQGPSLDLSFPEPPEDSKEQVKRFWKESHTYGTPQAVLRDGLARLQDAGFQVKKESVLLLPALYAALLAKPGEPVEELGPQAYAWALSIDDDSALAPVLDILLVAPKLGISTSKTLKRLLAVPAFTQPIPSEALLWTSSPGLALPRLAFELGVPKISYHEGTITPDLLDWAGMHARMRLSAAAHASTVGLEETDDVPVATDVPEEPDEDWEKRRDAVRGAMLRKLSKKPVEVSSLHSRSDRPVERVWNADGSSQIRISTDSLRGRELRDGLKSQHKAFKEKFGRDPGPDDPIFFDPDADEPVPLTKEYFDNLMLDMAGRAADMGMDPAFLHAWREVGYVVTTENRDMFTTAEVLAYSRAVVRHQQTTA
ncbi:hypothetical protein [Streptomyces sp. BPSDS2]|uniref:hypothetical protein n=1 Tax=Streptomyces sp. BPSDS2 TaxID=2571021 RepID=UPI0010C1BC28|nr:hypothetical protein [Streptomyces sp. BPSDS2]